MDTESRKWGSESMVAGSGPSGYDAWSKRDSTFFTGLYPLYPQSKRPSRYLPLGEYLFIIFELVTLSFYSTSPGSTIITPVAKIFGFMNLSSIGTISDKLVPILCFVVVGLVLLLSLSLMLVAKFYQWLMTHQPWIISISRMTMTVFLTAAVVPVLNILINTFDCVKDPSEISYFRGTAVLCLSGQYPLHLVSTILGIVFIALYITMFVLHHYFIFQIDPRPRGYFSTPSAIFQTLRICVIFVIVITQRFLTDWAFWRALITIGISVAMAAYVIICQPYYHFHSNFLICVEMTIYGSMRLCSEIGFIFDQKLTNIVGTIILGVCGLALGIVLSLLFYKLMRHIERSHWAVTQTKAGEFVPLFDLSSQDGKEEAWMHLKKHGMDRSIRWFYQKQHRTPILGEYVDCLYQVYLVHDPHNGPMTVLYGVFLQHIRKNRIKAHNMLLSARRQHPGIMYRSVLFWLMRGQSAASGSGGTEAVEMVQKGQLVQAENAKEDARDAQMSFFENLSRKQTNFILLQKQLTEIVKSEAEAKKQYESLLNANPNNVAVLRSYGDLLGVVLGDYEMADYVYLKADGLEDDTVDADPTTVSGDRKRRKKKKKKQTENGMDNMLSTVPSHANSNLLVKIGYCSNGFSHLFGIAGLIGTAVFVATFSQDVGMGLRGLRDVGELIMSGAKTSVMVLELLTHEQLLWMNMTSTNGSINPVPDIQKHMLRYADRMAEIVIEQMNTEVEKKGWEELRIETVSVQFDDVANKVTSTSLINASFLSLTTEVINFAKTLALSTDLPKHFQHSKGRIISHLYNTLQPFIEGGKRLLEDYNVQALSTASRMRTFMNLFIGLPAVVVMVNIAVLYIYLSITHTRERTKILREILEIPKTTIQKYARELNERDEIDPVNDQKDDDASDEELLEPESDVLQKRKSIHRRSSRKPSVAKISEDNTKSLEDESVVVLKDEVDFKWLNEGGEVKVAETEQDAAWKQTEETRIPTRHVRQKSFIPTEDWSARSLLTTRSDDDEKRTVTRRADEDWEDRFEKDVEYLNAQYNFMGKVIPTSTRILMVLHALAIFCICCGILLSLYLSSRTYSDFIDNVYMGNIRSVILAVCQTLLYRVYGGSDMLELNEPVVCKISTNPVWNDSSHLLKDQSVIRTLFVKSIEYWRQVNELTHYGTQSSEKTDDKLVDNHVSDRLSPDLNQAILLDARECFLLTGCTNKLPDRLYEFNSTSVTLQALTVRVVQYSWLFSKGSVITRAEEYSIFQFLATAIKEDLGGGQRGTVETLCEMSEAERVKFVDQAMYEVIGFSVLYFFAMFFALPTLGRLKTIHNEGERMKELTMRGEEVEDEVLFVEGMVCGCDWMDDARCQIVEKANSVIRSFKHGESVSMKESLMDELTVTIKREFRAEEEFMKTRMDQTMINQHCHTHRLILQRLEYIFDSYRTKDQARHTIAKRALTRLFDSHFIGEDVEMVNAT
ncbi:hypothetical protein BLNAU_24290 [Blattamonas nauphoetae]|uniref:TmcB/TmcC TPR repeats domain-containing protein n=1 Tax=Blattamonas nauphoetae TaxID=2049346 RepID=A0ABQ9WNA1_9EUKA|nr:hypothetical protein BLNAU_24290 [Blattamonas nauphoetae]